MTDKEIIAFWDDIARAIETGEKSGAKVTGVRMTAEQAEATYNLIKRLKRENNSYRNKAKGQKGELARLNEQVAEQKAEIEKLSNCVVMQENLIQEQVLAGEHIAKMIIADGKIKAEAIKEFAERLKKAKQYSYERHENIVPVAVIDWIVEEMVGDTK